MTRRFFIRTAVALPAVPIAAPLANVIPRVGRPQRAVRDWAKQWVYSYVYFAAGFGMAVPMVERQP